MDTNDFPKGDAMRRAAELEDGCMIAAGQAALAHMLPLKVKRLHSQAQLPKRALPDDAGFDFHAVERRTIFGHKIVAISTGVAVAVPRGWCLVLKDRSGNAANGLHVVGGVIDAGYRGEVKVLLANLNALSVIVEADDRVCQGLLVPVPLVAVEEVDELDTTVRGDAGFGSTGR